MSNPARDGVVEASAHSRADDLLEKARMPVLAQPKKVKMRIEAARQELEKEAQKFVSHLLLPFALSPSVRCLWVVRDCIALYT